MDRLRQFADQVSFSPAEIAERTSRIAAAILQSSRFLQQPDFEAFHPNDLERMFHEYDRVFFDGMFRDALGASALDFRISRRMTSSGGATARYRRPFDPGRGDFEITISSSLLFNSFSDVERTIIVDGLECRTRLDALQRVFEHELVHLVELLLHETSSCADAPFQSLARRLFGHTDCRHQLVTPREIAIRKFGIRAGMRVRFEHEGVEYAGLVNRITRRATVLVESEDGEQYSNGRRYVKFYVPVSLLRPAE